MKISTVIPCYGAPNTLPLLYEQLTSVFKDLNCDYEIILINDCCPQGSWQKILDISTYDKKVKGINLSRNFGQHAAISCGLDHAQGDWVIVMDCDLQDDPMYIKNLIHMTSKGYQVVQAKRTYRDERWFKKLQSWAFYKFLKLVLDVHMDYRVGNYGIYSKTVIKSIRSMGDKVRFFPYLVSWVGFPHAFIEITQKSRIEGKSSYSLYKSLHLAFDIAISSSGRPLIWSVFTGAICSLGSFFLGIFFFIRYFSLGLAPSGWTSLSVTIFFSTGIILSSLGTLGLYLLRVYDQTKERPVYLIQQSTNIYSS